MASALSLSVSAQITAGQNLGTQTLIACNGYNYVETGDPWTQTSCYAKTSGGTALTFGGKNGTGPLVTTLYDAAGNPTVGSDCFYAANFYIVYLFPDAWGGAGYQVSQSGATLPAAITNAMVFTPVYSDQDKYSTTGPVQGVLNAQEEIDNPQLTPSVGKLATTGGLILKAYRPRIVRAQYGIPPIKADGNPWVPGWLKIPLGQAAGTYTATVSITLIPI